MKNRILKGWNFMRVFYLAIGLFVLVQAIVQQQWLPALIGGYFASMGIFAFGCAAGNCLGGSCEYEPPSDKQSGGVTVPGTIEKKN